MELDLLHSLLSGSEKQGYDQLIGIIQRLAKVFLMNWRSRPIVSLFGAETIFRCLSLDAGLFGLSPIRRQVWAVLKCAGPLLTGQQGI